MARGVLIVIGVITLGEAGAAFWMLLLLWRRSKRIDRRNALLDRRVAAIGQVIVDLYPEQGEHPRESRAAKKAKALSVLRRIDEHDLDEARLAVFEMTKRDEA